MIDIAKLYTEINPIIREDLVFIASVKLPWTRFHNKTVLVTGGGGFLGAYLIKSLITVCQMHRINIKIICVARCSRSVNFRLASYLGLSELSVLFHDISMPLPSDFPHADFIIHCASQASPKFYGVDPVGTLLANTAGTMYLLNYAYQNQAENFLFFSSGEVYGVPFDSSKPVSEIDYGYIDPMNVRSCYAESKRIGETMCSSWAHQFNLHVNVVRPFHTYGPGMALDDGRVFADFVADVVAKRDIVLKSDGLALRPFCYISDAIIGFLTVLLTGAKAQAYNVANPSTEISIRDLAILLSKLYPEFGIKLQFDVPIFSNSYLKSPIFRSCPSIEKIRQLGWTPLVGLNDGFCRTIQSFLPF
ncbi:MAG: NAD-dependent epimerase/dehydratase family protein [Paludibacter sp.]